MAAVFKCVSDQHHRNGKKAEEGEGVHSKILAQIHNPVILAQARIQLLVRRPSKLDSCLRKNDGD